MGRILAADIECFSDVDLIKCGVYAYADSPAFEILLFAYSFDGGETQIIDLAQGEQLPAEVEDAIFDVSVEYYPPWEPPVSRLRATRKFLP